MSQFVCYNGEFLPSEKPLFFGTNRAFRYGDGIFETIRTVGTSIPLLKQHVERLNNNAKVIDLEIPESFTVLYFQKQITRLLNANKYFKGAKIRLSVFRKDGGNYMPLTNKADYFIESSPLETYNFSLNSKGLNIDLFSEWKKPINELSNLKTSNSLLYVKASNYCHSNKLDDCLLLNQNNNIIEATSSNLFIYINNNLLTPSLMEGCVNGIMRNVIVQLALNEKIKIFDDVCITENDIINADEVFFTNAVNGIMWVVAFKNRRYFCKIAKRLSVALEKFTLV